MSRPLSPALLLTAALALSALPAKSWDWTPPAGEPVLDLGGIDRLPPPLGLVAVAGLRRLVAAAPESSDLTGLDHGITVLDHLLFDTGRPVLMAALRALALDVVRHRFGEMSTAYAGALIGLPGPYGFEPLDHAAAEAPIRAGVAIARQVIDPGDRGALVGHLELLAIVLSELGQHDEAVGLRQEVLDHWRAVPDLHPMVLQPRIWALAEALAAAGASDEAAARFDEGLAILRADTGGHPTRLVAPLRQAAGVLDTAAPARARDLRVEARSILEAELQAGNEADPHGRPGWMAELADLLAEMGDIARAGELHLQALEIRRAALGDDHRSTWELAHRALAHLLRHDPGNPALAGIAALSARDPWRQAR